MAWTDRKFFFIKTVGQLLSVEKIGRRPIIFMFKVILMFKVIFMLEVIFIFGLSLFVRLLSLGRLFTTSNVCYIFWTQHTRCGSYTGLGYRSYNIPSNATYWCRFAAQKYQLLFMQNFCFCNLIFTNIHFLYIKIIMRH